MRETLTTVLELMAFAAIAAGLIVGLGWAAGLLIAGGLGGLAVAFFFGGEE